jgi:hypothetical protein
LCQKVYDKGWSAKTIPQLKRRIIYCLKNIDLNVVKASVESVPKRLRKCGQSGPLAVIHWLHFISHIMYLIHINFR